MSPTFFRNLILAGCAASMPVLVACSSTSAPSDGGGATGGNATGGSGGTATGGAAGGSSGAAGSKADAAAIDGAAPTSYFFTFTTAADVSAAAISNPSDTSKGDLSVFAASDGGPRATTGFDMTVGSPAAGSLEIDLPCNGYNQFVDYQFILPVITDLGRKTVSVMIRLDSGFSPTGFVYLYAKSGDNWDWGQSSAQAIAPSSAGGWVSYTFPMASVGSGSTPAFDPGYVKAIGVHIDTGAGSGATGLPTPAVLHLDSVGYQ
jgi:hypothetical protein